MRGRSLTRACTTNGRRPRTPRSVMTEPGFCSAMCPSASCALRGRRAVDAGAAGRRAAARPVAPDRRRRDWRPRRRPARARAAAPARPTRSSGTMPIQPRITRPCAMMSLTTPRTMFTGIAKPMPSTPRLLATMAVLMPTRSPLASTSAPPELPRLIAASVWMKSSSGAMPSCERLTALTMPWVTVCDRPQRIADSEHDVPDPQLIGVPERRYRQMMQARSSAPPDRCRGRCRRRARRRRARRASCTRIESALAMTWSLVMMCPDVVDNHPGAEGALDALPVARQEFPEQLAERGRHPLGHQPVGVDVDDRGGGAIDRGRVAGELRRRRLECGDGAAADARGCRVGPRIRSGRSATIRKASASPPTTDPATKVSPRPRCSSIVYSGEKPSCTPRARRVTGPPGEADVRLCIMRRPPRGTKLHPTRSPRGSDVRAKTAAGVE